MTIYCIFVHTPNDNAEDSVETRYEAPRRPNIGLLSIIHGTPLPTATENDPGPVNGGRSDRIRATDSLGPSYVLSISGAWRRPCRLAARRINDG